MDTPTDYFSDHRGSGASYGDPNPENAHYEPDPLGAFIRECERYVWLLQAEQLHSQSLAFIEEGLVDDRLDKLLKHQSDRGAVRNSLQSLADDVAAIVVSVGKDPSAIYSIVKSAAHDVSKFHDNWRIVYPLLSTVSLLARYPEPTHANLHAYRHDPAGSWNEQEEKKSVSSNEKSLRPCVANAAAAYRYVLEVVPNIEDMTIAEVHRCILQDERVSDLVPKNAETFRRYLNDAKIKRNGLEEKNIGHSVIRRSDL